MVNAASSASSLGAGPSSSSSPQAGGGVDAPRQGRPARAGSDPRLIVCGYFSVITAATALLCVAVNVVSTAQSFRAGSNIFTGMFLCCAVVAVSKTEWGFIIRFCKILEYWPARRMLQIFVAVMTKAYPSIERNDLIFQEIASYMLLVCRAVYVISVHTTPIMALPLPPLLLLPPPPPPPPPALPQELVEEILLRFPPADPTRLLRAALVCKPWCRLISSPRFRRRFHELHHMPPMLGFLCDRGCEGSCFVPTTAFCPPQTHRIDWNTQDAHHGRVLVRTSVREEDDDALIVWDPMTDEQWGLPFPPRLTISWSVAVLCAGTATGACDHINCHRGPFLLVFVGLAPYEMFVYTYSSDVKAWSGPISTEHPDPDNCSFIDVEKCPVLVGNALYFGIRFTNITMKYNLESREMSLIMLPSTYDWSFWGQRCMLTTTQEGVLGLVTIDHSKLCMWLRNEADEVDAGWTQSGVIDLKTLLPHDGVLTSRDVVGVAHDLGILFIMVESVLYTIDLKTSMVELYHYQVTGIRYIVPYMSFYTPELEAVCAGEGPSEGSSA